MSVLSRRGFIKATAASIAGAGGSSAFAREKRRPASGGRGPERHGPGPLDVAIIGSGAAGTGAALALTQARKRFVILEGRPRIGGRSFTDTTGFPGIRWDVGGEWLHQSSPNLSESGGPTNNPLTNYCLAHGIDVFPDTAPRMLFRPGAKPVNFLDHPAIDVLAEASIDIVSAGAIGLGKPRADISAAQATEHLKNSPWYQLVAGALEVQHSATLEQTGCADIFALTKTGILPVVTPSPDNWLIPSGYGALIARLLEGMPISLNTPVETITWGNKAGVALETPNGTVVAKKVIVTVPVAVLASGRPEFVPDLPPAFDRALGGLGTGTDEKIALLFQPSYRFPVPEPNTLVLPNANTQNVPLIQTNVFGHPSFCIVIVGGGQVPGIAAKKQLVPYALEQVVNIFGSEAKNKLIKGLSSEWNSSEFSMGSYTYARPGGVPSRTLLQEPYGNQIFFAGEGAIVGRHSSIHGAFLSGFSQAQKAVKALK
jgi:monoamine oxidase